MVVRAQDKDGNVVLDPSGVYLDQAEDDSTQAQFCIFGQVKLEEEAGLYLDQAEDDITQAQFRIFGQIKLEETGLKLAQDKYGDDEDFLVYREGKMEIPMETNNNIVTLKTSTLTLTTEQKITLEEHIKGILGTGDGRHAFVKMNNCPSFILNEANMTRAQIARLTHWRQACSQTMRRR
jgi:hypothetical protein